MAGKIFSILFTFTQNNLNNNNRTRFQEMPFHGILGKIGEKNWGVNPVYLQGTRRATLKA